MGIGDLSGHTQSEPDTGPPLGGLKVAVLQYFKPLGWNTRSTIDYANLEKLVFCRFAQLDDNAALSIVVSIWGRFVISWPFGCFLIVFFFANRPRPRCRPG